MSRSGLRKLLPVAVLTAIAVPAAFLTFPALAEDSDAEPSDEPSGRIVGGGTVDEDEELPWIVALHKNGDDFQCTSTQISAEWVLTAAHCVDEDVPYSARIGSLTRSTGGTVIDISEVRIHPDYEQGNLYDIALVKLADPFDNQYPVLATDESDLELGQESTIYGWGSEKENWSGPLPEHLKYSNGNTTEKYCEMPEDVCVIGDGGVAGGDSGGPVFVKSPEAGAMVLAGACEAGFNPSDRNWGGYASTVHNADWLTATAGL